MKNNDEGKKLACECAQCNGMDMDKFHKESMEEYGFYIHMVSNDKDQSPTEWNVHTHGVSHSFNHLDLQIVFPNLEPNIYAGLLHVMVNNIKLGQRYEVGTKYYDILENKMAVKFVRARENERDVMRMIVPDEQGEIDPMTMAHPYIHQYEKTGFENGNRE